MGAVAFECPFAGGIEESTREELVEPGSAFTTLENIRQNTRGGAAKRAGYTALPATYIDATTRSAGCRMFNNGTQLCVVNGTHVDVYSETLERSIQRSRVPEAAVRLIEAPSMGMLYSLEDVAVVNGYIIASYLAYSGDTGNVSNHYAVVFDAETGAVVRGPDRVDFITGTINGCRLAWYGSYAIAFTADTTSSEVRTKYLDTTSATTINAGWTTLATFSDFGTAMDVANITSNDRVALAYGNDSGGVNRITVKTLNIAGQLETVNVATASTAINANALALSEGSGTLWVAWAQTLTVRVLGLNPAAISGTALATVVTAFTADGVVAHLNIVPRTASGTAAVYATHLGSSWYTQAWWTSSRGIQTTAGSAATDGVQNKMGNAMIAGRPFLRDGRIFALASTVNQDDIALCDVTPNVTGSTVVTYYRPVAVPMQRGLYTHSTGRKCRAAAVDSSKYVQGMLVKTGGTLIYAATLAEYDFGSAYRWRPASVNGVTYLGGGVLGIFDGERWLEAGFLAAPTKPETDNTTFAGSLDMVNGRRYVAVYEEVDADGNWHTSSVSTPSDISGPQTAKICVVATGALSITARGIDLATELGSTALRVAIYATLDANNGEEPYYRLTRTDPIPNNPQAQAVSYSDQTQDAILATRALLYGTGNLPGTGASQDHRAPPGLLHVVSYNGMLVGSNGSYVYHSSQPVDREGQWFSPLFAQPVDGEITGLASQDGNLVIFTRTGAWIASGDPPSDNATLGGLSSPRRLAVDQGCINANSIVTTGIGTFYQSARGIELLTRGQTVTPIGAPIQDTLASYPVVSAAVLDATDGLVRFSLTTSQAAGVVNDSGVDLVFDLALGVWTSVDKKFGSLASQASQDACIAYVEGAWRYCWLDSDGIVYYQSTSSYLDPGSTWVTMKAVTPWIHISGIQGEQFFEQVLLLCKRTTSHDVNISLAFDYGDFGTAKLFTAAVIDTQVRQWLAREVTQTTSAAMRIKIEDATPSSGSVGTGQAGTWVALTVDGKPHGKPRSTSALQRGAA